MTTENLKPDLTEEVLKENPLKQMLVDYVGTKKELDPEKDKVNIEMIVEAVAEEFPEFVLALAESNFLIGYQQALNDLDDFEKNKE
ncbi:MAG: hypothetical protein AABY22_28725 [Nanoarchaeota archaeon]